MNCDHDFPERDGRCVGCGGAISGDALTIVQLRAENAELKGKLMQITEQTRRWNEAVYAIIGRYPETGIGV